MQWVPPLFRKNCEPIGRRFAQKFVNLYEARFYMNLQFSTPSKVPIQFV